MTTHRYLVALPFKGTVQTTTYLDESGIERVAYQNGLSLGEYLARPENHGVFAIERARMTEMWEERNQSLISDPEPETVEAWTDALNVLMPERYFRCRGWVLFSMSEYYTADITTWHARKGDDCYSFMDRAGRTVEELVSKLT